MSEARIPWQRILVQDADISVRVTNALSDARIFNLGDVDQKSDAVLLRTKNVGRLGLQHLRERIAEIKAASGPEPEQTVLSLLTSIRDLANGFIVDEMRRSESEPFISIWEIACELVNECSSSHLLDEKSGDIRPVDHVIPEGIMDRLTAMRDLLYITNPATKGAYSEMADIRTALQTARTFS